MFGLFTNLVLAAIIGVQAQGPLLPANCDRVATIAAGDTCDSISAKYNVSTYQLAAVNTKTINQNCTNLFVGEIICLGIFGQDCNTTYVIQLGNTCGGIASQLGIPMPTLLANNPNVNQQCTNIYPDEVLCVSRTIYPYNATSSP